MMKKHGFTLAEVLITLSIIGVVASMTMPALLTNTQEQQSYTGLKKGVNTLTEAGHMSNAIDNWDYASAVTETTDMKADYNQDETSLGGLLYKRAAIDFAKGNAVPSDIKTAAAQSYKAIYFKDGTAIYYDKSTAKATDDNAKNAADNMPEGYVVLFDTNGLKGPNIVSNCAGTALGAIEASTAALATTTDAAKTACETAGNKIIKDIFAVRLRGTTVEPEGLASTYVLSRK